MKRSIQNLSFLILVILFFTGCRTIKAPRSPYALWQGPDKVTDRKAISYESWSQIRERRLDEKKPLGLGDLIEIALSTNPSAREAWENARKAEYELKQAESALYPEASASLTATRQTTKAKSISRSNPSSHSKVISIDDHLVYGPSGQITYLLFDFGGRRASIREAQYGLLAKNFEFNQSILDLILNVETSYYQLISAEAQLEAAKSDLRDAKKSYDSATERFEVGLVSKVDVYQAKANYDDSLYVLEEAQGNLKIKKGNLAQALGVSADTDFKVAPPPREIPKAIPKTEVESLIDIALEQRPDIRALRAGVHAQEEAVKLANSNIWPTLSAGATAGANWYDYFTGTNATVSTRDSRNQSYTGYLSVDWNIFDGFNNVNEKRAQERELLSQRAALEKAELAATQDVWTKYYSYRTSARKYIFSESFLESSVASYELAFESYKGGLKDILILLDAQSKLSDARSKMIQAREDLFVSVAALANATGSLYVDGKIVED